MRRLGPKIQSIMQMAQQQAQAHHLPAAVETMKAILPYGKWMPLLAGQVHAQIGMLQHHLGKAKEAEQHLTQAGRRAGDAQLLLACLRFRDDRKPEAFAILRAALPFNRKHVLLHNAYAWLLHREGRRDEAMAVLNLILKKQPDEISKDNLLRLQNDQRLNMKPLGLPWYALGFESPPASMGELRTARKGFRTPPKGKKQK